MIVSYEKHLILSSYGKHDDLIKSVVDQVEPFEVLAEIMPLIATALFCIHWMPVRLWSKSPRCNLIAWRH